MKPRAHRIHPSDHYFERLSYYCPQVKVNFLLERDRTACIMCNKRLTGLP